MLWAGGYNFETPPPEVSATGAITVNPPTGARTLNSRTAMFFYATFITPAMIMRLTDIGSQYVGAFMDANGEYFDGGKTYKITLPPRTENIEEAELSASAANEISTVATSSGMC